MKMKKTTKSYSVIVLRNEIFLFFSFLFYYIFHNMVSPLITMSQRSEFKWTNNRKQHFNKNENAHKTAARVNMSMGKSLSFATWTHPKGAGGGRKYKIFRKVKSSSNSSGFFGWTTKTTMTTTMIWTKRIKINEKEKKVTQLSLWISLQFWSFGWTKAKRKAIMLCYQCFSSLHSVCSFLIVWCVLFSFSFFYRFTVWSFLCFLDGTMRCSMCDLR